MRRSEKNTWSKPYVARRNTIIRFDGDQGAGGVWEYQ